MSKPSGNPTPTGTLISRLRLMASAGGMLTRDRIRTILDAADRLEVLDERVAIMTENEPVTNEIPDQSAASIPETVTSAQLPIQVHKEVLEALTRTVNNGGRIR